ncbi:MAG: class I SAM-dependent methyltransferase [Salibacteraceae bacterium]|nr:class I SAM-dependent methyltransferase [Salibacteraceae bacterium]
MAKSSRIGNGFNLLAPIYDGVVFLFFGKAFSQLQQQLFSDLASAEKCLIVGGGSGEVLENAIAQNLASHYYYAELSDGMIEKTKNRISRLNHSSSIEFSNDWTSWKEQSFDVIILPFVLDCYAETELQPLLAKLVSCLSPKGKILFIDFNQEADFGYQAHFAKAGFITLLYAFFNIATGISAKKLPAFNQLFIAQGLIAERRILIKKGWIQAVCWSFR